MLRKKRHLQVMLITNEAKRVIMAMLGIHSMVNR